MPTVTEDDIDSLLEIHSSGPVDKGKLKSLLMDFAELAADDAGVAEAGAVATEDGNSFSHITTLAIDTALPDIPGGASLGLGKKIYTFPAGDFQIDSAYFSLALQQTEGFVTADTPEVGLGTVIASGVIAVLGGTATFENIIIGDGAQADCNGTAKVKAQIPTANVPLVILAAGSHDLFINVADGWAASGDAALGIEGTVVIHWRRLSPPA